MILYLAETNKKIKIKIKIKKKKKNLKKNKVKSVGIVDGISLEDITLGSKDSGKKKNKTKIKLGS